MKKEWILLAGVTVVTATVVLVLVRWLAPGLLGVPVDLQMVRTSREVPPFFENLFRAEDFGSMEMLVNDPAVVVRGRPLLPDVIEVGPNDILGFRNRAVPNVAYIVALGDSQTYGNNAPLELNWPGQLQQRLHSQRPMAVYNMSVGAWGGVNYLAMIDTALMLRPRIIVVALYTGNDAISDFRNAYSYDKWASLRPDPALTAADTPTVAFPPPESQHWPVSFPGGPETVFTPAYRLAANDPANAAVQAGYGVMARAAAAIRDRVAPLGVLPVFTIIPTKEYVYAGRIAAEDISAPPEFDALVAAEQAHIDTLARQLQALKAARYVDVVTALQAAAAGPEPLYPTDWDGHPVAAGYAVIAAALHDDLAGLIRPLPTGLVALTEQGGGIRSLQLLTADGRWVFRDADVAAASGWSLSAVQSVPPGEMDLLPYLGTIERPDADRFGPEGQWRGQDR